MNDIVLSRKLISKEAKFYHAINYADFGAYCSERSILSRQVLSSTYNEFTSFFSDELDKTLNVWNRIFGNLNDIGKYFWKYERATPNAYGPITIVLKKDIWSELSDITITTRTITSLDSKRITDKNVDEIFEEFNGHYRLKLGFTATEVSVLNTKISFDNIAYILIDPMIINGLSLRQHVVNLLVEKNIYNNGITDRQVIERTVYEQSQIDRISKLIEWARILRGNLIIQNEPLEKSLPENLKDWFKQLEDWKKRIMASWLTYIYNGTISKL